MATISKGNIQEQYVAVDSTYTFTPGSGGTVRFDCSSPVGSDRPVGRIIYAATTITIPGGSTFVAEAVGADATSTGAPVSGVGARFSGTRTAPISTFNGASSSGVVGTPTQLKIPANSIVVGQSLTELDFVLRKVGASTGTIDVRFGPNGGVADTVVSPSTGNAFTATDPQEFDYRLRLSYSAGRVFGRWQRFFATASLAVDATEFSVAFDATVDNYLSVVLSGMSAGTTVALVAVRFQHFQ